MIDDGETLPTAARMDREGTFELLRAVLSLGADLELSSVLQRFVQVSAQLTDADYAANNVLDAQGTSTTFVQYGVPETAAAKLAHSPHAVGVLGRIPDYGVLRLKDLRDHPAFEGFPAAHPPMGSFLGTAVRVHEEIFGYLYLSNKEPEFEDADVDVVLALAAAAAVAIQNAQLYADARARENWLRAGQEITTMLLSGAEEDEALERIARHAREIAEADSAVLILPGLGGELVMEIVDGDGADALLGTVMPRDGRAWRTMRGGAGELVESLYAHRQVRLEPMRRFGPALYAPMTAEGHAMGVLVLLRNIGRAPFGPHDLLTARSFAAQAALALRLVDARHVADAEALLDERERIARDLHDLAVQQLFATGMQLETLRRKAERGEDPAEIEEVLHQALENVDASVRQIRSIVHALKDPDAASGLVERLRREVSLSRAGLGFAPSFVVTLDGQTVGTEVTDDDGIDARVRGGLADDVVAVVREGLANAARHARASSVTVSVAVTGTRADEGGDGEVLVEVEDDGAGLDPQRTRSSGSANLAERARQHGGWCALEDAASGRGTILRWQAPLT